MSIGILGKKLGMTHVYTEEGSAIPITAVEAGPCFVLQVKTKQADGYSAIQLGFDDRRKDLTNKPDSGRFKKAGVEPKRFVREIRTDGTVEYKVGQKIEADIFKEGDYVDVTGVSIGKGFQGGVKRWGWAGGDSGHGSMFHRAPGSIQSGPRLKRVTKGKHMPGHMGHRTVTVQNLEVVKVDKENNLLALKGPVPGHDNSYLILKGAVKGIRKKAKVAHEAVKAKAGAKPAPKAAKPAPAAKK